MQMQPSEIGTVVPGTSHAPVRHRCRTEVIVPENLRGVRKARHLGSNRAMHPVARARTGNLVRAPRGGTDQ